MAIKIKNWLYTLHRILRELDSSNTVIKINLAKKTISNILCYFEEEFAEHEAGLVYSHLFEEENGILCFIQIAISQKIFADHVVIPALTLLKDVVGSNKCQIWKYVKKIQDFCWNLWRNSKDLSQQALEILLLIISLYSGYVDLTLVKSISVEVLNVIPEISEPQVLQSLYQMLGVSAKNCPEALSSIHHKIFVALIDGLEMQMEKEDGVIVIGGCLEGISDYLDSFEHSSPKEDAYQGNHSLYLKDLGEYERQWMIVTQVLHKFLIGSNKSHMNIPESNLATQAGLKFLIKRGSYVSKYLIAHYKSWNEALVKWSSKTIFSEYKLAEAASESFYHEISMFLLTEPGMSIKNALAQDLDLNKRKHMNGRMMYDELRATVKSLAYFSTLLKVMNNQKEIEKLFTFLCRYSERTSFCHAEEFPTSILMLPVYVEAISRVFGNLEEINIDHVVILNKLSINLFKKIPEFHLKWNLNCMKSVIMISYSLSKKPILQEIYLDNLLPQALIISCSPLANSSTDEPLKLTTICKNYLYFWRELFKNPNSSVFIGMSDADYANTVKHICAKLFKAALKVMGKLDLSFISVVNNKPVEDPFGSGYEQYDTVNIEMANLKDFHIISNLVHLLCEIISESDLNMDTRSLTWFMRKLIYYSEKNPLISAFYKLLSSCLSYCDSVNYFKVSKSTSSVDQYDLLNRMVWYLKNILPRVNRFDYGLLLQVSQLEVFLCTPTAVIKHLLKSILFPMQTVFRFGLKYPNLVLKGIETLERWTLELNWNEWHPILNLILPSLNHHLIRSGCRNVNFGGKFSRNAEDCCSSPENNTEALICLIQKKILLFLAKLPPSSVYRIVCDEKMDLSPVWSVRLKIYFSNMKTSIALDKVLPHVVELSLNSSDGKVRSTACELLYSILLLHFEGVQGENYKAESISEFGTWLMPILLQLASESALCQRLPHFFSSGHHFKAKAYILWIDSLMDGISHPHNENTRRTCGVCLRTLMTASLKESKEAHTEVVNTVIEKICTFSQHSSLSKRVGASFAINCLYSFLCENPLILDRYWMELLYYQLLALEENECTISKMIISTSLQQLEKVIKSTANIFNKHSLCRKRPPAFEGVLLKDAVFWIFKKCASLDLSCRRESMQLYLNLAPFVEGCHTPKDLINFVFERSGAEELVGIVEGGLLDKPPWMPHSFHSLETCSTIDLTSLVKWLNCLHSSLDCYAWCFRESLCDPFQLFQENVKFKIFDASSAFLHILKNICMNPFISSPENIFAIRHFKDDVELVQKISILENVFTKILEHLSVIIEKCQCDSLLEQNLGSSWILRIIDIINNYCLDFGEADLHTKEFHLAFQGFVESVQKYLSYEIYHRLLKSLADNLVKVYKVPLSEPENTFYSEISNEQMILARKLLLLHDCHLLEDIMKDIRFRKFKEFDFLKCAFNALFESHDSKSIYIELSESKLLYIENFLKLSFFMDSQFQVKNILVLAFDDTKVEGLYSENSVAKGEYFYLSFKSCLLTPLLSNLQKSIEYLLEHLKNEKEETLNIWRKIWTDLISDDKSKRIFSEKSFLSTIAQLLPWTEDIFIRKLTLLRALLSLPLNVLTQENWLALEDLGYWCMSVLDSQTESIIIKAEVLKLIAYFNHQKYEERLRMALQHTLEKYFLFSGGKTMIKCNGAAGDIILKATLIGLENTCNPALLRFMVMASSGCSLVQIGDLSKALAVMMKKVDPEKQFEAISSIYSLSSDEKSNPDTRITSVKNFLKRLIQVCDFDAAKNFFASNIKDIVKILQEDLEITSVWLLKPQLVSRIVSFLLIEIMFLKFGKAMELRSCPISVAYNDGNPNEKQLIREVTRRGWEARKTINCQVDSCHDLFRQYRCAAYNALIAIISSLKEEEKFYLILFEENLESGDLIWEGLVDTSMEIIVSRSLEKRIVNSTYDGGCESDNFSDDFFVDDPFALERYDFCDCSVRTKSLEVAVALQDRAYSENCIEGIHNHDCMVNICGLIGHMVKKEITHLSKDSFLLPLWVRCIKKAFEEKDRPRNIKIFLMITVLNCEKFYTPYAKHLLTPIMECVANGDFGQSVNHLLENVVELILSWSETVSVPMNSEIASKLLDLFVVNDQDLEKEKYECYLHLVRSILRLWHNKIDISHPKLIEQIQFDEKKYKQVEFVLLVCCILMEHSIIPWSDSSRSGFLNNLLKHLLHNRGGSQMASACLTGLVLRQMDPNGTGLNDAEDFFTVEVIKFLTVQSAIHKDNFLMCLNEIQRNYFNIVDKFLPTILCLLPKLNGVYQTLCLEMISKRGIAKNPLIRLKDAGLFSWLDVGGSRDQEIALTIIKRNISKFQSVELTEIVDNLSHFHHHGNINCRRTMYEILKCICEKYGKERGSNETFNLWIKKCERMLLIGLADEDSSITNMVLSHWKGLNRHNTHVECLISILQLFSPDIEKYFFDIVISLLLLSLQEKGSYQDYFLNLELQENHTDGNKEPTSGCLSSKTLSSSSKKGRGKRTAPKDWQKCKWSNELRRKARETRRRHERGVFESHCSHSDDQSQKTLFLLKALAKEDLIVGRQLLVSLIGDIIETAMANHDKSSHIWTHLNHALNSILKDASSLSKSFIGAILEISIGKHDFIELDNEMVTLGECALLDSSLYLESKLIIQPLEARKVKSDIWMCLSKLYQQMDEKQVVWGILLDCLKPREEMRKALQYERIECWNEALPYFQEVLNLSETGNFIFQEKDLYYEEYFRCLANLSQWEQINKEVLKLLNGSFSRIWDNQNNNLFPWLFASCLRIELESKGKSEEFFNSVYSWMKNEDRRNYMKTYFSKDIAAVYFLSAEWDQVKYFIGNTIDTFLQTLSNFVQGSSKQKMVSALQDIQLLGELSMFLSIFDSSQMDLNSLEKWMSNWMVSCIEPLEHLEERIAFRNVCLSQMKKEVNCGDALSVLTNIEDISVKMTQYLLKTAISARNYQITKKYLKKSELMLRKNSDPRLRLAWQSSYGSMSAIVADGNPYSSLKRISSLIKSVYVQGELLTDPELGFNPALKISIYDKVFVSLKALTAVLKDHETLLESVDNDKRERFFKCIKYSAESQPLMQKIIEYGTIHMKEAISIAETLTEKSLCSEVYLSIAKYCLDLIGFSSGNLAYICMKAFLRAILFGSREARDWFPRLLLFDFSKHELREVFKTESSQIPPWMFLGWTNQIVSHLNGFACYALEDIVIKLCQVYPGAILIPHRLNYEECVSTLMQRIHTILSKYKTAKEMIDSLKYVSHPEAMFGYHLEKIISLLEKPKPNISYVKEACLLMMKEIFPCVGVKRFHGILHEKLYVYKEKLKELFGNDFCELEDMKSATSVVSTLNFLKKETAKKHFSSSLEDYSYWLKKFRISDHMDEVEIPGQYTGDGEPLPELLIKIHGFSSTVFEVPSLKSSVCIAILGTDGREHRFLIKYGKDLRIDQRVSHLLHIMNKCLLDDLACLRKDLRLDNNEFIPLSSHHGMIKWNKSLMPIIDVITKSINEKDSKQRKIALEQYYGWLKKSNNTDDTLISIYRNAFLYYDRDETVINYEKLIQALPCDNLRRSFMKMSVSLEDFFHLRGTFASCYSVECIAYWLLGVGKCNQRKVVVQCTNGRVSCIDLGHCFGSAVYSFPIPELTPFRLTSQVLGLMQPFGEIGLMKEAMINTLRVLQRRHEVILSVITVMVKEPFLDWLINIRKDYSIGKSRELVGDWNPEKILNITQRKFIGGINPTKVTLELLDLRINEEVYLKEKMKEVVRGNCNIRTVLGDEDLSCEQQVSCLIDMATDFHILGKTCSLGC